MVPASPTARATEVRSRRATLKRAIAERPTLAVEVLRGEAPRHDLDVAHDMKVADILRAVPGLGPASVREILEHGHPPDARLYWLTMGRRREIAGRLEAR